MNNKDINNLLHTALYAGAEATDRIHGGGGEHMRKLADDLYGVTCSECQHDDPVDERGRCTHVSTGQSDNMDIDVCGHDCGAFGKTARVYLDRPQPMTGTHNSSTCHLGKDSGPCEACVDAIRWERRPFAEQASYDLSEQQQNKYRISLTKFTENTIVVVVVVKKKKLTCRQCGWEWIPRKNGKPVKCPNQRCQSTRWTNRALPFYTARVRAITAVNDAVRKGRLPQLSKVSIPCIDCGERATDYDHRDYSKPLEVDPVCHGCNIKRGTVNNATDYYK